MNNQVIRQVSAEAFGPADGIHTAYPLKFAGVATRRISRVDAVRVVDWQGKRTLSAVARRNVIPYSNGFATLPWSRQAAGTGKAPALTPNYAADPSGGTAAWRVQLDVGATPSTAASMLSFGGVAGDITAGAKYTAGFWIRATTAAEVGKVICLRHVGRTAYTTIALTADWKRVAVTETAFNTTSNMQMGLPGIAGATSTDFLLFGVQLEAGALGGYISTNGASASLLDYTVTDDGLVFGQLLDAGTAMDWDGAIYWQPYPSLLPPNATAAERAVEGALAGMADLPVALRDLWSSQNCPEKLLPWLAWALSIDTWKSYWPIDVKRARVASAIEIQRRKGTAQSVHDVIASFGGAVEITEWWQQTPLGAPYTFHLQLALNGQSGQEVTADYVDDVIGEVMRVKPVRSQFDFTQVTSCYGAVGVFAVARPCLYTRLSLTA